MVNEFKLAVVHFARLNSMQTTGLKNRWLADEFLQGRVRTTLTADLLRGLEALGKILGK